MYQIAMHLPANYNHADRHAKMPCDEDAYGNGFYDEDTYGYDYFYEKPKPPEKPPQPPEDWTIGETGQWHFGGTYCAVRTLRSSYSYDTAIMAEIEIIHCPKK